MPSPLRMPRRGKLVQIDLCCGIFKHLCSSSRIRIEFRYQSAEFQISRACLFRQICSIFEIYALTSWEMGAEKELAIGISNRQKEGKDRKRGRGGGSCSRNAAGECRRRRRFQLVLILTASCGGCRCRQGTQLGKVIKGGTPERSGRGTNDH